MEGFSKAPQLVHMDHGPLRKEQEQEDGSKVLWSEVEMSWDPLQSGWANVTSERRQGMAIKHLKLNTDLPLPSSENLASLSRFSDSQAPCL